MERIVNYSSEDDHEDSPKRNANIRDKIRGSSYHKDNKEASLNVFRKNSHREESNRGGRPSSTREQYHHRDDRRSDRQYDKKRDSKDDRRRKDSHRERDREHEHRDLDRDRRDRSDKHRRDKHAKDNSHREKDRRRKSPKSPTSTSKDHNVSSSRNRNRSRSRSPSKEQKPNASIPSAGGKHQKYEQKEETTALPSVSQNKSANNLQAVLNLPLNNQTTKTPIVISKTDGTPIALPTYYNPNVINPTKYADQVQKRKLIWGAKKAEDTSAKWGHATFSEDQDGKVASKFMRLMGIKSATKTDESASDAPPAEKKGPDVKSRQAMFSNMEQQYEVARQVTHTMRGVGLGFGSQSRQF